MSDCPQETAPAVQSPQETTLSATDYAAIRDARSKDLEQRRQLLVTAKNLVAEHIDWKIVQSGDAQAWKADGISLSEHRKQIAETYRYFMRVVLGGDQS